MDQNQLWNFFTAVDKDRSGNIGPTELQACLSNGSWEPFNIVTIKMMINLFDPQRTGKIAFQEFQALWKYVTDWQNVFSSYDRDHSLSIDASELSTALTRFGYSLTPPFIMLLTAKYDRTGTRTVSFDDFIQICILLQALTNEFKRYDVQRNGWAQMNYEQFLTAVFNVFPGK